MNLSQLKNYYLILVSLIGVSTVIQSCQQQEAEVTIHVDVEKIENTITPWLYGACIEDVNHEIYGGLYDQKIFGENFEEPVPSPKFNDFSVFEGSWEYQNGEITVKPHSGPKLVYDLIEISNGFVEVDLKFDNKIGDNAGLIFFVNNPTKGADTFYGYEVSLYTDGKKLLVGKHKNNYEHIKDFEVNVDPLQWNKLKIIMQQGKYGIYLNDKLITESNSIDESLIKGKVALRTWNSNPRYRNLKIVSDNKEIFPTYETTSSIQVSDRWDAIQEGNVKAVFALDIRDAYNGNNSQTIQLVSGSGKVGISNLSLNRWGIAIEEGKTYDGHLYLKTTNLRGNVTVSLQSADGEIEYAKEEINNVTGQWEKYLFVLTPNMTDKNARFAIYINQPGKVWIDQVTLMTAGDRQFRGLPMRKDIGEAMVNQGLTFLRYGGTMVNIEGYRFKKMIGDRDKRPPYTGHWYRYSTNGFGIEDFLQFCEAAGFVASFAINIEETPQDAADMVEYLNGPVTSEWGKMRAENGHPDPYNIKYIGIGNEEVLFNGDRADEYDHYVERFNLLYDAMKTKDPDISLVSTAWWRPDSPNMERVFKALDGKAEYWDYHPWADQLNSGKEVEADLKQMKELFLKWNPDTKMKCAIFEENGRIHNIQRVLGHVTVQNAVRRMGDFILTSCAANALQPYKQNDNGWDQGQVFFTPSQVWGMPPFYAQQMASENHQPLLINSYTEGNADSLDVTATRSEDGNKIVLHIANTANKVMNTLLNIDNFGPISAVRAISLSGELSDVNTPEEPERISPHESVLKAASKQIIEIAPYSYTIVILTTKAHTHSYTMIKIQMSN